MYWAGGSACYHGQGVFKASRGEGEKKKRKEEEEEGGRESERCAKTFSFVP
jgi:hypothetical protein